MNSFENKRPLPPSRAAGLTSELFATAPLLRPQQLRRTEGEGGVFFRTKAKIVMPRSTSHPSLLMNFSFPLGKCLQWELLCPLCGGLELIYLHFWPRGDTAGQERGPIRAPVLACTKCDWADKAVAGPDEFSTANSAIGDAVTGEYLLIPYLAPHFSDVLSQNLFVSEFCLQVEGIEARWQAFQRELGVQP